MSVTITLNRNASIKVEGEITLIGEDGQPMTLTPGKAVFLCRCGDSKKRPFCDGTHKTNGYCSTVEATA
jgi:CDGSH-type Zn-finger protein